MRFFEGKSYNMAEIVTAIADADGAFYAPALPEIQYSEIDCGEDGVPELLADAPFGDEFHLLMIIKEIDGELVICFDQDSWSRSYVEVKPNGVIEGEGSGGAAIHIVDHAFVDGKGEYKFYYDDSNELKKKFTDAGVKTYTKSEMDQMLKDRAAEIGYPGV